MLMADFGLVSGSGRYSDYYSATATASATVHTKGAYVELIAQTPFVADVLKIIPYGTDTTSHWLIDIAIGAAGSETIILENLQYSIITRGVPGHALDLLMSIPAGSRISARVQGPLASEAVSINCQIAQLPFARVSPFNAPVLSIGANAANSSGVSIPIPATAGAFGAWTELSASTPSRMRLICPTFSSSGQPENTNVTVELGVGAAAAEVTIFSATLLHRGEITGWHPHHLGWLQLDIPASTRVAARTKFNGGGTTASLYMMIHGVR